MTAVRRWLDQLDEVRQAATRGWNRLGGRHDRTVINDAGEHVCDTAREADAALIVAAVNALPTLIAEVRALTDRTNQQATLIRAALDLADGFDLAADLLDQRAARHLKSGPQALDHYRLADRAAEKREDAARIRAAVALPVPDTSEEER